LDLFLSRFYPLGFADRCDGFSQKGKLEPAPVQQVSTAGALVFFLNLRKWLRGLELHQRLSVYETDVLLLNYPALVRAFFKRRPYVKTFVAY
jgi:hypothetical protein